MATFKIRDKETGEVFTIREKDQPDQRPTFGQIQQRTLQPLKQKASALNLADRAQFAFGAGDPAGQKSFLEERFKIVQQLPDGKFVAGNDIQDLRPVDPEGFFEDALGDLVDLIDDAIILGGQIGGSLGGAAIGTAAAPGAGTIAGTVAGGSAGAASAQAAVSAIGQKLGVRQKTLEEEMVDVAITGAFGAVGEGAGLALSGLMRAGGNRLIRGVGNIVENTKLKAEGTPQASIIDKLLPKTFKITANVPERATETVLKNGSKNVFSKFNTDEKNIVPLVQKIQRDIFSQRNALGARVAAVKDDLLSKTGNRKVINIADQKSRLMAELEDFGLTTGGQINKNFISERGSADVSIFRKLLTRIDENSLTSRDALIIRDQLSNAVDKLSGRGKLIAIQFLRGSKDGSIKGVSNVIEDVAERAGANRFVQANRNFSNFTRALDDLGLNVDNPVSIQNFVRGFLNKGEVDIQLLRQLDSLTEFPLLRNIENFAAAQAFKSASPNLLRLGAVAGFIGVSFANTPEGKLASGALGLTLGSPFGAKQLLKLGDRLVRKNIKLPIKGAAQKIEAPVTQAASRALLTRILQLASNETNQEKIG